MISHFMKQGFTQNLLTKLAALVALPVIKQLRRKIDPRRYNGASLVGLRGIAIKSHGGADVLAFSNAIRIAIKEVHEDVPRRICEQVEAQLDNRAEVTA